MQILKRSLAAIMLLTGILAGLTWAADTAAPASEKAYTTGPGKREVATLSVELNDEKRSREIPVKIYFPKPIHEVQGSLEIVDSPLPVIIFSHGLGGSREGYGYLGQRWAGRGYIVVHLQHHGSDGLAIRDNMTEALKPGVLAENAVERVKDVTYVLDELARVEKGEGDKGLAELKGRMDLKHIGMAGHSFGAQTTQMVAGQVFTIGEKDMTLGDSRITAAIAMSPALHGSTDAATAFGKIAIPVLYLTGTKDKTAIEADLKPEDRRIPYDHTTEPGTILITFDGADHMVFSGIGQPNSSPRRLVAARDTALDTKIQSLVLDASTAYWDAYLKNDPAAKKWLEKGLKEEVGTAGKVESK